MLPGTSPQVLCLFHIQLHHYTIITVYLYNGITLCISMWQLKESNLYLCLNHSVPTVKLSRHKRGLRPIPV